MGFETQDRRPQIGPRSLTYLRKQRTEAQKVPLAANYSADRYKPVISFALLLINLSSLNGDHPAVVIHLDDPQQPRGCLFFLQIGESEDYP